MAILTVPTDAELSAFAACYAFGRIESARGIEAGTVNTNFALETRDGTTTGRWFLRLYEEQDAVGATREAKLLTHLASHGIPTPAPVLGIDGQPVRTLAGRPAALFPWMDGDMLCQRAVTPETAETMGAALGRIHLAGHAPGATLDTGRFDPAHLVTRCDRIANAADPVARGLADPLRHAVAEAAARRRPEAPRGLVHCDLFRDNVLWARHDRSKLVAILDFESAHDGPFAYDLGVTLLSWSYGSSFDTDISRAIVRGYESVRTLEPIERESLYDETILATLRFTITRITDNTIRVGKRWQRFVERREAIERLGRSGFAREVLGL